MNFISHFSYLLLFICFRSEEVEPFGLSLWFFFFPVCDWAHISIWAIRTSDSGERSRGIGPFGKTVTETRSIAVKLELAFSSAALLRQDL